MKGSANERLDFGKMGYGCEHYRRRCLIRAPCCNEIFPCRHCHNEVASMLRSLMDRHEINRYEDKQIEATTTPEEYRNKKVWILCNDCNDTTEVYFHIIGQKCSHCKSYNTRQIAQPVLPQS